MTADSVLVRQVRSSDHVTAFAVGQFLVQDRYDVAVVKYDTVELYALEPDTLRLQHLARQCFFAPIARVHAFPLRDQDVSVFDDVDDFDVDDVAHGGDAVAADADRDDKENVGAYLKRCAWRGTDFLAMTSENGFLDLLAMVQDPVSGKVKFVPVKTVMLSTKHTAFDHRDLGSHLSVHAGTRDIAIAAFQDTLRVLSVPSPSSYLVRGAADPAEHDVDLGALVVWHLFHLQSYTFAPKNHLVAVGYRDVTKQAVVALVERTDQGMTTYVLPFDAGTPTVTAAFPLPFRHDACCIVTENEVLLVTVSDMTNGNVNLARSRLNATGLVCSACTIPDRITPYVYLLTDHGDLIQWRPDQPECRRVQRLNVHDAQLAYLGRDVLEGIQVDILLAMSPVSDWQMLLVGDSVAHTIPVSTTISPVSHAIAHQTRLLVASGDALTQVISEMDFTIESESASDFEGLDLLFALDDLVVLAYSTETVVLQLQDGELRAAADALWRLDATTLAFFAHGSVTYQVLADEIRGQSRTSLEQRAWRPDEGITIDKATPGTTGIVVLLHAGTEHRVAVIDFDLPAVAAVAGVPLAAPPTCIAECGDVALVGTYDAQVAVVTGNDSPPPPPIALGDAARIPNSLLVHSDRILIGCRDGTLVVADTTSYTIVAHVAVGVGPVALVAAHGRAWCISDGRLFEIVFRGGRVRAVRVHVGAAHVAPFVDGALIVVAPDRLVVGRVGDGVVVRKHTVRNMPSVTRLLAMEDVVLACHAKPRKSLIQVLDDAWYPVSDLLLDQYVMCWQVWSMPSQSAKILVGTASVQNQRITGGQFLVYQLQRNSLALDPKPYRSHQFQFPVRALVPLSKMRFAAAVGNTLMVHALDTVSKSIVTVSDFAVRTTITCLAANDAWIAVGTIRDSVMLLRVDTSGRNLELIGADRLARHVLDLVWWNGMVVGCDRQGSVFGLEHDPHSEIHTLKTRFDVRLGHQVVSLVVAPPITNDEGDGRDRVCAVTATGAMYELVLTSEPALVEVRDTMATRSYMRVRCPFQPRANALDMALLDQYEGDRGEVLEALDRWRV
ncbi:hypothetical protein GGF32_008672 [Allomyces javanicus]|nr:hypothetical protein GGF32_008672 [Allomyces javanicus]